MSPDARRGAGSDSLTVLTAAKRMVKTWRADGTIAAYDEAKNYRPEVATVANIRELSRLLFSLEPKSRTCIVRGRFIGFEEARKREPLEHVDRTFRQNALFDDQPLHSLLIEVDDFDPLICDPMLDTAGAIDEYIKTQLPQAFNGASCHWQLSNSAGHPTKRGLLKAHLWFWLRNAYTSEQLKAWAKAIDLKADHSVFQKIQCHYTGAPIFEAGVVDPVKTRSGFVQGASDDVDLCISAELPIASVARPSRSEKRMQAAHADPIAQHLLAHDYVKGQGSEGKLHIVCPFADEHSGPSTESATSYFPAHTGGYELGQFKCLHAHCADRSRGEFLAKIGYIDAADAFEVLPAPPAPAVVRRPRTAHQILTQKFSELRWVVPKVLPEGVYLLIAAPKIGKSWLALQMVLAVASGSEVLGQQVEAGAALYLALEDNDRRLQKRLRELDAEMLLTTTQAAALQFETQWPLSNEGGAEAIGAWLTEHPDARLVVVDVLERFRPRRAAKAIYTARTMPR